MNSTDVFVWNQDFKTDILNIDEEHKKLVEIINAISKKLSQLNPTIKDIQPIFEALLDYTHYHFKNEETIMKNARVDVRHAKEHIASHRNFIKEITTQYSKLDKNNIKEDVKKLLDFLVQWLTFHILGTDKNLANQIKFIESGDTPEEAYNTINSVNYGQLGTLVKSFNGVFAVLIKSNEELLMLKQHLEEKVEKRTKELQESNTKLKEALDRLEVIAMTDQLTSLANRHKAILELSNKIHKFKQNGEIFSIIMLDVDNFKIINDTNGHQAGDEVLSSLASSIKNAIGDNDIACRFGGDEFLVICPNTDKNRVLKLANAIKNAISEIVIDFDDNSSWVGSASIGLAICDKNIKNIKDITKIADANVYLAKRAGKNKIIL